MTADPLITEAPEEPMNEHYQAEDWLLIHSYYDTIREGLTDSAGALVPGTMSERQHVALCALDDVRTLALKYFEMAKAHAEPRQPDPWPVIDWLRANNPEALELCPYKVTPVSEPDTDAYPCADSQCVLPRDHDGDHFDSRDGKRWTNFAAAVTADPLITDQSRGLMLLTDEVGEELHAALRRFPSLNSPHEGKAVIEEELDELWEHVKANTGRSPEARKEAIQVAAMAIRYALDLTEAPDG